jgi:hypothetical protein
MDAQHATRIAIYDAVEAGYEKAAVAAGDNTTS